MKVYGYMKCGTCRKALKWLDAAGIDHDFVDITLTPPNASLLKRALATGRYELKHLFNTSGGQYRAMDIKHRLPEMTKIEAIAMLANNGMLCKRPVVTDGVRVTVGFKEDVFGEVWG